MLYKHFQKFMILSDRKQRLKKLKSSLKLLSKDTQIYNVEEMSLEKNGVEHQYFHLA